MQRDHRTLRFEQIGDILRIKSFFQDFANKEDVMNKLEQKLYTLNSGVTLMVTHQVVIRAATGQSLGSGELVAFNTLSKATQKFRLD